MLLRSGTKARIAVQGASGPDRGSLATDSAKMRRSHLRHQKYKLKKKKAEEK